MTTILANRVRLAAAVLAVALVAVFTVRTSLAAFSDTTANEGNAFSAGLWQEAAPFDLASEYGLAMAYHGDSAWLSCPATATSGVSR